MPGAIHYVPILKGFQGEYGALYHVPHRDRLRMSPLIEFPPLTPGGSMDHWIQKHVKNTAKARGEPGTIMIDLGLLGDAPTVADGQSAMAHVAYAADALELPVIPVTGPRRLPKYQEGVRTALDLMGEGVCLRLDDADLANDNLEAALTRLMDGLGVVASNVDVVLDFKAVEADGAHRLYLAAASALTMLPFVHLWRSVTIAATAFPADLSTLGKSPVEGHIGRAEWVAWAKLQQNISRLPRLPRFGDYSISHPVHKVIPKEAGGSIPVAIRYTMPETWFIRKEGRVKDLPKDAFRSLARWMIERPEYRKKDFSWGDAQIYDIATNPARDPAEKRKGKYGNPGLWRKIGISHHFAVVNEQLSKLKP